MPALSKGTYSGLTVTYGDVQFGGSEALYASLPPEYALTAVPEYDQAGRSIVAVRYTLEVVCAFFAPSDSANGETTFRTNMAKVQAALSKPGKVLTTPGLNLGIGEEIVGDLEWGPKPGPAKLDFKGALLCIVTWSCEFKLRLCANGESKKQFALMALNFGQTWQHDLRGIATRVITGYAQVPQVRLPNDKHAKHTADEVRDKLNIICPVGFRRLVNTWQENPAKNIIEFSIVDEQLPGTAPPSGIMRAEGSVSFGSDVLGFSKATMTMSMQLETAHGVAPEVAGLVFIKACLDKQASMLRADAKMSIMPTALRITHHKYDDVAVTEASCTWTMGDCFNKMLQAAGIWEPITENNYTTWRKSVEKNWGNRGAEGFVSVAQDDLLFDLCDNVQSAIIGRASRRGISPEGPKIPELKCPDIPIDGGWIAWDLQTLVHRHDDQTWHKQALEYLPSGSSSTPSGESQVAGPQYAKPEAKQDVVEYHGLPEVYVLVSLKATRFKHEIKVPKLISVAGQPAVFVRGSQSQPRVVFDLFTCPVWHYSGWQLYRVNGYVPSTKPVKRPDICSGDAKPAQSGEFKL